MSSRLTKDFSKGKIYQIICHTTGLIYVGHTCDTLKERLWGHIGKYNEWIGGKNHYITVFEVLKHDNYEIVLIEDYPCDNIIQLEARERYFIESMVCVNKNLPGRTSKEYIQQNKEKRNRQSLEYRNQNKDSINEMCREKIECECGSVINKSSLRRHKKTKLHLKSLYG